ncbi:sugar phosphate isomerase/epimerase family protein [Alteribacillus sp. HJP-4]|uniref:sugar phosphate isomerase/epimerase family protein n=1 Tax=Alteribacillus sp. HJP-4 TaxID=2775394 RepID=UPI0035CD1CD4
MNFGLRISDIKYNSMDEIIQLAVDCNLQALELSAAELIDLKAAERWKKAAENYGLTITTAGIGIPLCNPSQLNDTRDKLKKIIEGALLIGNIPLFSRTLTAPEDAAPQDTWAYLAEFTREVTEVCADHGLPFAIEIDHAPCFVNTLERFEKLYRLVNHTNLKLNFDPTNLHVNGSDPFQAISEWGHLFIGGHIKDGIYRTDKRTEVPLGEGDINYNEIFKCLKERGIHITFHFEHLSTAEQVRHAVKVMNNKLASSI